jgi:7-keto-8-aminopelargonate synthetase-like enzyme
MSGGARAGSLIPFAGTDYLGLARDVRLAEALGRAALDYGISATSSRWALGFGELHERLEGELASFLGTEDACLLGAAYLGGATYFSVLAGRSATVYCDEACHANLFLGMKAAGLRIRTYRHLDAEDLGRLLLGHEGPPPVVASDGVYGISGEIAPLRAIAGFAGRAGAELLVDDAHGVFALGREGRGALEVEGVPAGGATLLGSMSKALGAGGGFLAGRRTLVEEFRRSATASGSSLPPLPIAAACLRALKIAREEPDRRHRLEAHARRMRAILEEAKIAFVSRDTPIVAMKLANASQALGLSHHFRSRGLAIPYFRYASEPRENLLRAAARANLSEEDLGRFREAVAERPPDG